MTRRIRQFSLRENGNDYISPNFQVKEFRCKDGSDEVLIDLRLVHLLQQVRDHFGQSITINSGYRTRTHNANVSGAANSQHLYGRAADIVVQGVAPSKVAAYVEILLPGTGGIGRYQGFTHIDTRETRSRWNG